MERRLAAIVAADIVGYSRLMGEDEPGTVAAVALLREAVIQPTISEPWRSSCQVRWGTAFCSNLPSAVEAIESAVEIQRRLWIRGQHQTMAKRL